jgi:Protein of unknown function (DUF4054)
MFGFPDISGFYAMLYGTAGVDLQSLTVFQYGGASGVVFPGNPPYTVTDFLGIYPKFLGPATSLTGLTSTLGSAVVSGFNSTTIQGISTGQLIVDPSFSEDTLVVSVDSVANTVTLNSNATISGTTLTIYKAPFVPIVVLLTFTFLARASVMRARYHATWKFCVSLFVAHYATLYMRTESQPNATASQVASSGLTKGILITRAAGDVSATSQLIAGYEQWGAWTETQYGEQFITIARATNCGPIWVP